MTVVADMHVHSTASDGQYTPSELVRQAKNRRIAVLALTDHDTLVGLEEAVQGAYLTADGDCCQPSGKLNKTY